MPNNKAADYLKVSAVLFLALFSTTGCASMAHRVGSPVEMEQGNVCYLQSVPPVSQKAYQCGPAALESVFRHWGRDADSTAIAADLFEPGTHGVFNFTLSRYARSQGFWTQMREASDAESGIQELKTSITRKIPLIVMLKSGVLWVPTYHFVVLKGFDDAGKFFYANIGEPDTYAIDYPIFRSRWQAAGYWFLIVCPPERVDWDLNEADSADLALYSEREGKFDLAQKWYQHALQHNPSSSPLRFNLANSYLNSRQFEEAKLIYSALLRENPAAGQSANNLAWIYLEQNQPQQAADIIESAFKNGAPRQADILDTLGMAYCRLSRYEVARQCLLEAIQKIPPADAQALALARRHLDECSIKNS